MAGGEFFFRGSDDGRWSFLFFSIICNFFFRFLFVSIFSYIYIFFFNFVTISFRLQKTITYFYLYIYFLVSRSIHGGGCMYALAKTAWNGWRAFVLFSLQTKLCVMYTSIHHASINPSCW